MKYQVIVIFSLLIICTNAFGQHKDNFWRRNRCSKIADRFVDTLNKNENFIEDNSIIKEIQNNSLFQTHLNNRRDQFLEHGDFYNLSDEQKKELITQECLDHKNRDDDNQKLNEKFHDELKYVDTSDVSDSSLKAELEHAQEESEQIFSEVDGMGEKHFKTVVGGGNQCPTGGGVDGWECVESRECKHLARIMDGKTNSEGKKSVNDTDKFNFCKFEKDDNTGELIRAGTTSLNLFDVIEYKDLDYRSCNCLKDPTQPFFIQGSEEKKEDINSRLGEALKKQLINEIKNDYSNHIENLASLSFLENGDDRAMDPDQNPDAEKNLCYDEMKDTSCAEFGGSKTKIDTKDFAKLLGNKDEWKWKSDFKLNSDNPLKLLKNNMVASYDLINKQEASEIFRVDPSLGIMSGVAETLVSNEGLFDNFKQIIKDGSSGKNTFYSSVTKLLSDNPTFKQELLKNNKFKTISAFTLGSKSSYVLSDEEVSKIILASLIRANRINTNAEYITKDPDYALNFLEKFKAFSSQKTQKSGKPDRDIGNDIFAFVTDQNKKSEFNKLKYQKIKSECGRIAKKVKYYLCMDPKELTGSPALNEDVYLSAYDEIKEHLTDPDMLLGIACNKLGEGSRSRRATEPEELFTGAPFGKQVIGVSDTYMCDNLTSAADDRCSDYSLDAWKEKFIRTADADTILAAKNIMDSVSPHVSSNSNYNNRAEQKSYSSLMGNSIGSNSIGSNTDVDVRRSNQIGANYNKTNTAAQTNTFSNNTSKLNWGSGYAGVTTSSTTAKIEKNNEVKNTKVEEFDKTVEQFVKSPTYQKLDSKEKEEFDKQIKDMREMLQKRDLEIAQLKNDQLQKKINELSQKYEDLEKRVTEKKKVVNSRNNIEDYSDEGSSNSSSGSSFTSKGSSTASASSGSESSDFSSSSRSLASSGSSSGSGANRSGASTSNSESTASGVYLVSSDVSSYSLDQKDQEVRNFFSMQSFSEEELQKYINVEKGIVKIPLENGKEYEMPIDELSPKTKMLISELSNKEIALRKSSSIKKSRGIASVQLASLEEQVEEVKVEKDKTEAYAELYAKLLESIK